MVHTLTVQQNSIIEQISVDEDDNDDWTIEKLNHND